MAGARELSSRYRRGADYGTNTPWHIEGGKGAPSRMVKFQLRPDPLAY